MTSLKQLVKRETKMSDGNEGFRLVDHVSIKPEIIDKNKFDKFMDSRSHVLKDQGVSKSKAIINLKSKIDASRTGSLVNGRVYKARMMDKSVDKWVTPYKKPVLPHHDQYRDAIGRVDAASFDSFIEEDQWDFDHILIDLANGETQGKGSGRLLLDARIIDTDAIDKVLDGRYSTVSIGFMTDYMKCSICGADWKGATFLSPCDHRIGQFYKIDENSIFWDGKKTKRKFPAYLHCGDMDPREVSFVNTPAQSYSSVIGTEMSMDENSQVDEHEFAEIMNMLCVGKPRADAINSLVLTDGYTSQELLIDDLSDKSPTGKMTVSVPAIDAQDIDKDDKPEDQTDDSIGDSDNKDYYTDEEFACLNILRSMQDCGTIEPTVEESLAIDSFSDAKLSTKQRESLKSSTFCGPDRSFPVPDCAHVTAALRLLGRYKGSGDKSKIKACVMRKAKQMDCKVSTKNGDDSQIVNPNSGDSDMADKDTSVKDQTPDKKDGGDQTRSSSDQVTIQTLTDKIQDLSGSVTVKDAKIEELEGKLQDANKASEDTQKELTDALVLQYISMRRVLKGDIPEDEEAYKKFEDELKVRSVDSLRDSIKDMTKDFNNKVEEIQKSNVADSAGSVQDPTNDGDNPGDQDPDKKDDADNKAPKSVKDRL